MHGADRDAVDDEGKTALVVAKDNGFNWSTLLKAKEAGKKWKKKSAAKKGKR